MDRKFVNIFEGKRIENIHKNSDHKEAKKWVDYLGKLQEADSDTILKTYTSKFVLMSRQGTDSSKSVQDDVL